MQQLNRVTWMRWLVISVGLGAIYYGAAKLGMAVALPIPPGNVTPVWPPSPIAWTGILWFGYRVSPIFFIADFLASTPSYFEASQSVVKAVAVRTICAASPTMEAILGNYLIQRFIGRRYFLDQTRNVFKFALIATISPAINALIGVTALCLFSISAWADFASVWSTWWIGNMISLLVLMPMLLAWREFRYLKIRRQQVLDMILALLLLVGIGRICFGMGYPVEYLLIPCLIWTTFRFGHQGATTGVVIVVILAILGTVYGHSSFLRSSLNESLVLLQTFMGTVAITTLTLAAVLSEQRQSEAALAQANQALALQIEERITAFARLQEKTQQLENTLQELRQTQTQLVQTEKMSSLGQLVAGVAHEINNPINFIAGNLVHVEEYSQDLLEFVEVCQHPNSNFEVAQKAEAIDLVFLQADLPKVLASMRLGTDRIQRIVTSLRNFSRTDEAEMQRVNIHEGINSTLLILQHRLKAKANYPTIEVVKNYSDLPLVECYVGQLNQVFMNLLANAIDALEEGSKSTVVQSPTITITTQTCGEDRVAVRITDNGIGIPDAVKAKLFDPFYTTKPVGKGTGLGLAISHQIIVEKHRGDLKCFSELGQGTEFWIKIPVQQGHATSKMSFHSST